jgi:hypothetical protein
MKSKPKKKPETSKAEPFYTHVALKRFGGPSGIIEPGTPLDCRDPIAWRNLTKLEDAGFIRRTRPIESWRPATEIRRAPQPAPEPDRWRIVDGQRVAVS